MDDDIEIIERDPTGQYVRYEEILGEGSSKIVYKGFDQVNGIEIAWSITDLSDKILKSNKNLESLYAEADLLKTLKHQNIMICYHSWVDNDNKTINMITELFTSGNLRQYLKKHNLVGVDNKAVKNWAKQILKGLDYLHCHDPPIIHRDLNSDNLFVNGNSGKVKIGDLGLAMILEHGSKVSGFSGTPEFMAPEFFENECNQLVDIYSFVLCLLELLTREIPYSECTSSSEVYKRISSGVKPASLTKVTDPQDRPSAIELLNDEFFAPGSPVSVPSASPITDHMTSSQTRSQPIPEAKKFRLQGKTKRNDAISMTLWVKDHGGHVQKVEFVYLLRSDTIVSVAEEMQKELGLSAQELTRVSELLEDLLGKLVP